MQRRSGGKEFRGTHEVSSSAGVFLSAVEKCATETFAKSLADDGQRTLDRSTPSSKIGKSGASTTGENNSEKKTFSSLPYANHDGSTE